MGTSKSYITPTNKSWTEAKRATTKFLKDRNSDNINSAISKYAKAMRNDYSDNSKKSTSAISRLIGLRQSILANGLEKTLKWLGIDLVNKKPEEILNILLEEFCNNGSTIEEHTEMDTLYLTLRNLNVNTIEELVNIQVDILLKEIIIVFINENFKLRFEEKIGLKRSPAEKQKILDDITGLMRNEITEKMKLSEIASIDFSDLNSNKYINDKIIEALDILDKMYLED